VKTSQTDHSLPATPEGFLLLGKRKRPESDLRAKIQIRKEIPFMTTVNIRAPKSNGELRMAISAGLRGEFFDSFFSRRAASPLLRANMFRPVGLAAR
jgi:hypothetical protein